MNNVAPNSICIVRLEITNYLVEIAPADCHDIRSHPRNTRPLKVENIFVRKSTILPKLRTPIEHKCAIINCWQPPTIGQEDIFNLDTTRT